MAGLIQSTACKLSAAQGKPNTGSQVLKFPFAVKKCIAFTYPKSNFYCIFYKKYSFKNVKRTNSFTITLQPYAWGRLPTDCIIGFVLEKLKLTVKKCTNK